MGKHGPLSAILLAKTHAGRRSEDSTSVIATCQSTARRLSTVMNATHVQCVAGGLASGRRRILSRVTGSITVTLITDRCGNVFPQKKNLFYDWSESAVSGRQYFQYAGPPVSGWCQAPRRPLAKGHCVMHCLRCADARRERMSATISKKPRTVKKKPHQKARQSFPGDRDREFGEMHDKFGVKQPRSLLTRGLIPHRVAAWLVSLAQRRGWRLHGVSASTGSCFRCPTTDKYTFTFTPGAPRRLSNGCFDTLLAVSRC